MSTNRKNRICIIIPCYNEAASLPSVAADLRKYLPEAHLLFINDASTDNSETVLNKLANDKTTVINLPINLGIGGGVQTGLLYAARNGYDYAVKFDGDGQHPASALEDILAPVISGEADLSIGSRFLSENDGFKSTFTRRLGIRIFRVLSTWLTGQTITDSTSGYRAYNRRALLFAARHYPAFDYPEPEEAILFIRNGLRVREVPCRMAPRENGHSSINPLKSVYYMMKVILSVILAAFRPKKNLQFLDNIGSEQ